jgi:hypothetical protein
VLEPEQLQIQDQVMLPLEVLVHQLLELLVQVHLLLQLLMLMLLLQLVEVQDKDMLQVQFHQQLIMDKVQLVEEQVMVKPQDKVLVFHMPLLAQVPQLIQEDHNLVQILTLKQVLLLFLIMLMSQVQLEL